MEGPVQIGRAVDQDELGDTHDCGAALGASCGGVESAGGVGAGGFAGAVFAGAAGGTGFVLCASGCTSGPFWPHPAMIPDALSKRNAQICRMDAVYRLVEAPQAGQPELSICVPVLSHSVNSMEIMHE